MPDIEARPANRHMPFQQGKLIDGRNTSMTSDSSDQQLRAMLARWSLDIAIDAETASDPRLTALAVGFALSRCASIFDESP
ncbi:hypothetical protein [Pararhizobium haloflavum]|uniref:hypothetical protein n=1 Tax=Pararhizobium haloflavum TaxID=2037914 RepID=UPI00130002A9|nr:hypothetical protein [Pararhizobium haloflavum]